MNVRNLGLSIFAVASLIGTFEGVRHAAYLDPVGIPTACFGMTAGVELGQTYTQAECEEHLMIEVVNVQREVRRRVAVEITPNQLAAFTSFTYNVGVGNFERSTLLVKLNQGDVAGACDELPRWVYAKGVKLPGLVARRAAEQELCLSDIA